MNASPNREKVLLNLKWFAHRLVKSFEIKLVQAVSRSTSSMTWNSPNSSPLPSPVNRTHKNNVHISTPCNELPLLRQLLEDQLRQEICKTQKIEFCSQNDLICKRNSTHHTEKSPLMRIRSLTNSPLFRRLSLSAQHHQKKYLLSPRDLRDNVDENDCEVPDDGSSMNSSVTNSPLHPREKCLSNPQSPIEIHHLGRNHLTRKNYVVRFYESCSDDERARWLLAFGQQLCIIYEYQLGMLRGLTSIHAAADYIADFLIKAVKLGKLTDLTNHQLTPVILFDNTCRPSSHSRCVKTCPLPVTGEQLTWRLGEMWTLPGLRHNEVGGENCHNLSIVTHFLSASAATGELSRSDIYGYRNLVLLLKRQSEDDKNLPTNKNTSIPASSKDGAPSTISQFYFDLAKNDYITIAGSKVKTGTRDDVSPSANSTPRSGSNDSSKAVGSPNRGIPSPELSGQPTSKRILAANGASTIRQHLHRAYRPVFFVIFNRPSVIEHLTECDSFAAFCKRQSLSPVMFLNQPTSIFDDRPYPCIYQNFDLFSVSVSGYSNSCTVSNQTIPFTDVASRQEAYPLQYHLLNGNKTPLMAFPYLSQNHVAAYDNPGFAR
ncbi:unnamed protein product [Calicophoron daubneyi]|uniref:Uncharacterized protein n=1 Tax=Calicophoron daubneyi TaxID=300641 RepID=A0AAV2TBV5_CALDB